MIRAIQVMVEILNVFGRWVRGSFAIRGHRAGAFRRITVGNLTATPGLALWMVGASAGAEPLLISRVAVVDTVNGEIRRDMDVLVENHRIQTVGPTQEVQRPSDAKIVDGSGKYLIPGLWDMHAHLGDVQHSGLCSSPME